MAARRRLWPRILLIALALVLVAGVAGYWRVRPLLLTGTGYAAHNACAVGHVAGRGNVGADDLPPNPLVPYLKTSFTDTGAETVVLGLLARQKAFFLPGYGCTLAEHVPNWPSAVPVTAAGNPYATATAPQPSSAVAAALSLAFGDDLAESDRLKLGTRGIVVLKNGNLVAERYASGFTATTPQLGWSMSKSVTNLMVGRLVLQGKVALNDDHLRPEWTDDRSAITVDHLLRMSSGLSWDETYDLGTPITEMLYGQPDMGAYVAGRPLAHAVGTYQQYSSGSTTLLCSVLKDRLGDGPNLPRAQVFAPLGLASAVWENDASGTPVCSSYLWATPRDWAAIGQFALADGIWNGSRLLPAGWMKQSTTVLATGGEEVGYAAGWWVNRLPDGSLAKNDLPADAYWANGHDGQRLYVVPSSGLVVVRLGFSPSADDIRTDRLVADLVRGT